MENIIYFAVGFKCYDIAKSSNTADSWYDRTERSKNFIRRVSFNRNTMEWIVQTLRKASKTRGNFVRRWKKKDNFSETFCSRNYNSYGRYISIISIRGKKRSVLIIPEVTFNAGWTFLADKVSRFLSCQRRRITAVEPRLASKDLPFTDALRNIKWSNQVVIDGKSLMKEKPIHIKEAPDSQNEVLNKCLVGTFPMNSSEIPTLSAVRRWTSSLWKQAHGLNIYEIGDGKFLFEFSFRTTAEQIMEGEWCWKKSPVNFQWWTPLSGAVDHDELPNSVWAKLVGLPL